MKKCVSVLNLALLVICLLTGCARQGEEETLFVQQTTESTGNTEIQEPVVTEAPKVPYDLLQEEWQAAGKLSNSENWWKVTEYVDDIIQPQEGKQSYLTYTDAEGADFYAVIPFEQAAYTDYFLNHFDAETMQTECVKLLEKESDTGKQWIVDMSVSGGEVMVFVQLVSEEELEMQHYYACLVKQDGTLEEVADLAPVLEKYGLTPEPQRAYSLVWWDCRGYFYLLNDTLTGIYVTDESGNLLDVIECEDGQTFDCKMRSPEGIPIWEKEDVAADTITYFCYGEEGMQNLHEGVQEPVTHRYMNEYGEIIYVYQTALVRWNAASGVYERLYVGTGMQDNSYIGILQNSQGKIVLLTADGYKISACSYSLSGPARRVELELQVRGVYDYATRSYIDEFVRKHPGVTIKVTEQDWDNKDAEWTQLLAELAAGKGPDLLLLEREEMLVLQEKGVLADLSEVLPKELEEQIFRGVLDNGRVNGKLYGMTYDASYSTLMVSKEVWPEETWSIGDVLDIIENLEAKGTPIEAFCNSWMQTGGQTAAQIFSHLIYDLENSPFLDLEKGECCFETEEFYRLLDICKRYGSENVKSNNSIGLEAPGEMRSYVKNGQGLAYTNWNYGLSDFSQEMAGFDNGYHCVGHPTDGASGNYWNCYTMMAVNAKAEERDIIDELLCYFYSEECQTNSVANTGIIVRRDLLTDSIVMHVDWADTPMQNLAGGAWAELPTKADGSTYLEEYLAMLDSCVAMPSGAEEVKTILEEEVGAYFAGTKSAEEVAGIVQSRVQLYLDERN